MLTINAYRSNSHLYADGQCLSEEGTIQGDPLAMAINVCFWNSTIDISSGWHSQTNLVCRDDPAATSTLEQLGSWWDLLNEIGPLYKYFPNGPKTHLGKISAHPQKFNKAKETFKDTATMISEEGKRYLGGAMDTASFVHQFVERKVGWLKEVESLQQHNPMQLMLLLPMV